jgi:TolB-like protein/Flp pilus assembly protein TadD
MLSPGSRLGSYEIQALLGSGGMGEVYRAQDTRLRRTVALKVLNAELAADPERRARFEREAQSVAALNHPNIVTIYSVEDAGGVLFLTMELVEGQPLSDLIVKGGLPLGRILPLVIPLADAVSAAHQKGITHRDLKPANVMVTADGRVKVLDFGLAKLMDPSPVAPGASGLPTTLETGEGRIVGTVAYMSPEQAEGRSVDQRSDIFSLGVILFELATGERPFKGDTSVSLLSSIIKDTPTSIADLKPACPRELARIVKHCLVKDPEYRYQSAKDLRNDLHHLRQDSHSGELEAAGGIAAVAKDRLAPRRRPAIIATATALAILAAVLVGWRFWNPRPPSGGPIESLAVLPFVNVGADPNAEYLSDGITENLINSLSQLPQLRVVPRSTVFRYKGREIDLPKIGRELTVRAVLTGRVVQRGDTLNIQTELVDVAEDSQLWGRQFMRPFADLITVQDEIATAVSERLRLTPNAGGPKRAATAMHATENPEAHQLYLKGQYVWNRRTGRSIRQAAEYFLQAIDKDPGYGLAWARLADCYGLSGFYGAGSPREAGPRAKEAALRALRIDDTLAEAHMTLGWIHATYDWDRAAAEKEYQRALELNPSDGLAMSRYTVFLEATGRIDEALVQVRKAQQLEPASLIISSVVGRRFHYARQYDQASAELRRVLELDPNFAQAHLYLGWVYEQQHRYEDAIAELRTAYTVSEGESETAGALGHAYAVSGRKAEAERIIASMKEQASQRYIAPFDFALIYLGLGEKDSAFEWLEKAYDDRSTWLFWINVDPRLDPVRNDPRFRNLLRRMRLAE